MVLSRILDSEDLTSCLCDALTLRFIHRIRAVCRLTLSAAERAKHEWELLSFDRAVRDARDRTRSQALDAG